MLQFIHPPENVWPKVLRDIIGVQYFLPMGPFKPGLLIDTPLQFMENASWQAENFKCTVHQFSDFVQVSCPNN